MFRLSSLNLNGIRSAMSKGLETWLTQHAPDCICVQELKAQDTDLSGRFELMAGMQGYFACADKKGYSGVGVYTRHAPSAVIVGFGSREFDAEGRYLELRFDTSNSKVSIISCYFPSGSSGADRQEAKFRFLAEIYPHLQNLARNRNFILCGDINIAHRQIDLKNWRSNQKNSGFLPQERDWMSTLLGQSCGLLPQAQAPDASLIDVFRRLQPSANDSAYTWWSNRGQAYANNVGWRLDYQIATQKLAVLAHQVQIYKTTKFSDHAPITVDYENFLVP
ncbi:MAG: exodeoxyribonuclease III [Burkholderiaceae bacterium]